jgi:hypothetical protein
VGRTNPKGLCPLLLLQEACGCSWWQPLIVKAHNNMQSIVLTADIVICHGIWQLRLTDRVRGYVCGRARSRHPTHSLSSVPTAATPQWPVAGGTEVHLRVGRTAPLPARHTNSRPQCAITLQWFVGECWTTPALASHTAHICCVCQTNCQTQTRPCRADPTLFHDAPLHIAF